VIESAGGAVAWFPDALPQIVAHPAGRAWAARSGSHVRILRLEGT
jgi:hypothetical protein